MDTQVPTPIDSISDQATEISYGNQPNTDNKSAKHTPVSSSDVAEDGHKVVDQTQPITEVATSNVANDSNTKLEILTGTIGQNDEEEIGNETYKKSSSSSDITTDKNDDDNVEELFQEKAHYKGEDLDDGDPIPSGTGVVSRDCSASDLVGWSEILPKWHNKLNQRPKGLQALVRNGIPEPLRGEVWQLLAGAQQHSGLMEQYRIYLTKSAPAEQIILRDVHRTYPAHDNFRSGSGSSSLLDSLFKVCKAYAVYDEEVGYCQGLSFLVAALLLHMPEEQAFCVFVCIMQHYGLRDLFRNNFDELYLKFYQLERLLEEHMPDLYQHFNKIGIEPFTYASQWFLTVFTAKFPLNAVFYIMDIFLLDGMNTIFQVALALLAASKQDLLALDFEGVLKYFRVQMPKRYRNQENVQQLICKSSEISVKRLKKHAKSYESMKQKEKLLENPVTRLQRENIKLTENNIRLEQENDDLARDLVSSKIQLRAQLDALEDKMDTLNRALTYSRQDCQTYMNTISDMEDERSRLEIEVTQLKEVCRRELQRAETEQARDSSIIADYKRICSQLSKRLDCRYEMTLKFIESMKDILRDNESCGERKCLESFCAKTKDLIESLKTDNVGPLTTSSPPSQSSSPISKSSNSQKEIRAASVESDPTNRPVGAYLKSAIEHLSSSSEHKIQQLTKHVDELEVELARTKLALVEAECKCQQLTHEMNLGVTVKTSSGDNKHSNQRASHPSTLSDKLVSVKAAIASSRRSPKSVGLGGGGAFARINNIISEKISNIGQAYPTPPVTQNTSMSSSKSTPMIAANLVSSNVGQISSKLDSNNGATTHIESHRIDDLQC